LYIFHPFPAILVENTLSYQWRSKFGGMDASMIKRLNELEAENARLKKMYAEETFAQIALAVAGLCAR
jgi:hypothetical protein